MTRETRFFSPNDSEKTILVSHDKFWENAHFYHNGELIRSYTHVSELQKGVTFEAKELGSIEFKVNQLSFKSSLKVNGDEYWPNGTEVTKKERPVGALIIFALLALINFIIFLFYLLAYEEFTGKGMHMTPLYLSGSFMAVYTVCFVFLMRGNYYFYLIGLALFTLSTLYVTTISFGFGFSIANIFLLFRFILIGILFLYFKRALKFIQEEKDGFNQETLDQM
ncbi:MAG: hypothetical protein Crog4KO_15200 [Crocinitomicaceae bacterium]